MSENVGGGLNEIWYMTLDESDLPFKQVNVYNMFRFHPEGIHDTEEENDIVKALPQSALI